MSFEPAGTSLAAYVHDAIVVSKRQRRHQAMGFTWLGLLTRDHVNNALKCITLENLEHCCAVDMEE